MYDKAPNRNSSKTSGIEQSDFDNESDDVQSRIFIENVPNYRFFCPLKGDF